MLRIHLSTTALLFLLASVFPASASTVARSRPHCVANQIRGYFLMTPNFKNGTLQDVIDELPKLKSMGVNTLWISPPNPQTAKELPVFGPNNHRYWVSEHGVVDPEIGGDEKFRELVSLARKNKIEVCVDVVLNHFGYGGEFKLGKKTVSVTDRQYFRTAPYGSPLVLPRESELHNLLSTETSARKLRELQRELADYPLYLLPAFNHSNPEVAAYLIKSYKNFVDMGVTTFRLDAVKHFQLDFLQEFTEEMTKYAASKGKKLRFINEMLFDKSHTLDVFAKDILAQSSNSNGIYFIDFPLASEVRRLQDPNYQLDWLIGFLKYRETHRHPLKNYIPMIENHDLEEPIRDAFISKLSYALSEFVSFNPTFLHHGAENAATLSGGRTVIQSVDPKGNIAQLRNTLSQLLASHRTANSIEQLRPIQAERDFLLLERTAKGQNPVYIVVNKSNQPDTKTVWLPNNDDTKAKLASHYSEGPVSIEVKRESNQLKVKFTLPPRSFSVFEMKTMAKGANP